MSQQITITTELKINVTEEHGYYFCTSLDDIPPCRIMIGIFEEALESLYPGGTFEYVSSDMFSSYFKKINNDQSNLEEL